MINYNIEQCIQKSFKWSYTFVFVLSFGSHNKSRQQKVQSKCGDIIPFSSVDIKILLSTDDLLLSLYYYY